MNLKIRLFRKPVTTVCWVAVLTAMALLLGIGANLLHSSDSLLSIIDQHHTTIGVQTIEPGLTSTGKYQKLSVTLSRTEINELSALDSVEKIDLRTLTGAYIPELTAQIGVMDWGYVGQANMDVTREPTRYNESYNHAVLTGIVEYFWWNTYEDPEFYDMSKVGGSELMEMKTAHAIVLIDQILTAHPDYVFFPGTEKNMFYTGHVHVIAHVYSDSGEPCFEVGQPYIFSGSYNPMLYYAEPDRPQTFQKLFGDASFPKLELEERYRAGAIECSNVLTMGDRSVIYEKIGWRELHQGSMLEEAEKQPYFAAAAKNEIPVAQKLTGTVEELLASDPSWAEEIAKDEAMLHSFPVLGTEALETMYVFNRNEATIIEGRTFTQEEYDSGAKVCVISEQAALSGGIDVGDMVSVSQFICGRSADEGNSSLITRDHYDISLNNPGIGRLPMPFGLVTENEQFQVVGIYKLERSWDSSAFSITPNTVFIPQKAQITGGYGGPSYTAFGPDIWEFGESYANGTYGVYFSVQIKNGRADEFLAQAKEIVPNLFHIFDQGYAAAEESVRQVAVEAWKLIGIASVGWILLLALYVLLYQNKERQNLGILRSIGGNPADGRNYLFGSGFLVAAVGVLIGSAFSSAATRMVSKQLAEFMISEGSVQASGGSMQLSAEIVADIFSQANLPITTLVYLAAAQMAVIALALWIHATLTARQAPRKLLGV